MGNALSISSCNILGGGGGGREEGLNNSFPLSSTCSREQTTPFHSFTLGLQYKVVSYGYQLSQNKRTRDHVHRPRTEACNTDKKTIFKRVSLLTQYTEMLPLTDIKGEIISQRERCMCKTGAEAKSGCACVCMNECVCKNASVEGRGGGSNVHCWKRRRGQNPKLW